MLFLQIQPGVTGDAGEWRLGTSSTKTAWARLRYANQPRRSYWSGTRAFRFRSSSRVAEGGKRVPESASDRTVSEDAEQEGETDLPRRTVVLGAAWALPVISAAIAAPLTAVCAPAVAFRARG